MEWMNLTDICRPKQWKTIAMKDLKEKGYPVYGANGIIGFYDKYTHEEPTVMITCRGATCGTINKSLGKAYINGNAMALDNLKYEIVDMNYLYYYLNNYNFKKVISGSAQPQITRTNLKKVKIPVPPMETQEKIVKALDQAQALIDKRKEQIKALDLLTESIFYTMFGDPVKNEKDWELKRLGELVVGGIQNGLYKPSTFYTENLEGTPIIRIDAFYEGKITNYKFKRVKCTDEEIRRFLVENNDIIINRVNSIEYLGKNALVNNLEEKTIFESNMMKFKTNSTVINNKFLIKIMNTDFFINQILSRAKKAVNQASINQKDVKSFLIPIPPLNLQNEFAQKVEIIEKQKELLTKSLELLEENYKSIMDKAFKGQLFN